MVFPGGGDGQSVRPITRDGRLDRRSREAIEGRANGTTFMEISKSNFRPMQICVPPQPLLDEFKEKVEPLHRRMVSNLKESRTLSALRDALLPKLLSGELRVPTGSTLAKALST